MNGYELSRSWFDWCFENPELISPNHTAIFFFAIEHCNRLGWKTKFGFPTQMAMDALGIRKHQTYIKYFNDLVDWGFFKLVQKSTNQYSSNIISLQSDKPKNGKALDKAIITHTAKQTQSNGQSNSSIDKQDNNITNNHITGVLDTPSKKFIPPTVDEVKAYFEEKGYTAEAAIQAHEYYKLFQWHDKYGNPVKSWKQKMFITFMKPENKKQTASATYKPFGQ